MCDRIRRFSTIPPCMKVHELVELLLTMPQDHEVVGEYNDGEYKETYSDHVSVSLDTVKVTNGLYHRGGHFTRYSAESGKMEALAHPEVEVVLIALK